MTAPVESFVCDDRDIGNLTDLLLEYRKQKQKEYIENNRFVNDQNNKKVTGAPLK